jgi:type I restriction enzyme S subunit
MAADWRNATLGQVCSYINRGAAPAYVDAGGALVLNQKCIRNQVVDFRLARRTDLSKKPVLHERMLQALDILVNSTGVGTLGRVAQVLSLPEPTTVDSHITILRPDASAVDPRYLGLAVRWCESEIETLGEGSTGQTELSRDRLRDFVVPLAPNQEQSVIAQILGTLDDKIQLNRRMNETLEAIAQAIFNSWFVDFGPVRAKASGEPPQSICRRLGLTPELLALFPDRLVDSELGEVPEGWEVKPLSQITTYLNRGISPKYIESGGVLVLNQKCVRDGRVDTSKARRHDPAQRSVAGRFLDVGDVLVNSTGVGTLGRVAQVLALDEPTIADSHVTVVRADQQQVSWNYLGVALVEREAEIEALGEGSTGQTELSRGRLGDLKLMVPAVTLRQWFDESVLSIRLQTKRNDEQAATLASIRDGLLPKLLTGEIRVTLEGAA